ncbi:N-acetylglucosamine-6-phosphate deacetylase [Yoonia sp. BS5-3]|uniref:N-acetylglucosamine-6-phosphate deacetylase n=1 Tax=Yoonia phaeophyticola TaxID=3137369 RepID=A0ABZ2V3N5_9RHOB
MGEWIAPDRLFDGHSIHAGLGVLLDDGQITRIEKAPATARQISGLVSPGFVDLQVNGGGGVMLNNQPDAMGIKTILAAHRRFGTTALMPTVITDHPDVLARAADAAISAKDAPGMLGLHIEGPHIAPAKRGTHAGTFIRPLDDHTINIVGGLRKAGLGVMITLAPESCTAAQIKTLTGLGAVVSLGHTNAAADQMQTAIAAGATCITHLFNAMSAMEGRAPGAVGAAINSHCYAGIICDGHHVDDSMLGLAIRARPTPDRMFLVSDAMATVGGPNQFELYSQTIQLKDGKLVNAEGALAGAHLTMAAALTRLVQKVGIPAASALRMATTIPAACIGADRQGQLIGQKTEDTLILNADLSMHGTLSDILLT